MRAPLETDDPTELLKLDPWEELTPLLTLFELLSPIEEESELDALT